MVYHTRYIIHPDLAPTVRLVKGLGSLCALRAKWRDSVYTRVLYSTSITRDVLAEGTVNGAIHNVAIWGSRLGMASCEGVLRLRVLTLRSQHRGSRTGTVARSSGVAGTALKGRVEVVNGFL